MRKIAKQLQISTSTVSKILSIGQTSTKPFVLDNLAERIVPKAFQTVENAIDKGDASVAMRYLERTALAERKGDSFTLTGDNVLVQAVQLLPPAPAASTAITPSSAGGTDSARTEAAAKPPQCDIGLSIPTNFSNFSLAELEQHQTALAAELERRRAQLIEAEVVP